MENTLKYLDVENGKEKGEPLTTEVPKTNGQSIEKARAAVESKSAVPVIIGSGETVKATSPSAGKSILIGDKVFIVTDGELTMPDTSGWSKRELLQFEQMTDVDVQFDGSGYVVKQSVDAGESIQAGDKVMVSMDSLDPLKQSPAYDDIIDANRKDEEKMLRKQLEEEKAKQN
jgi:penicillin-binding protein 1